MTNLKKVHTRQRYLPLWALLLAALFWLLDVMVDFLFFNEAGRSFEAINLSPEPEDLWMRGLVIAILFIFALIARKLMLGETRARQELENYKATLELKVEERTREIHFKNEELKKEIAARKTVEEELQKLAVTDPLTGLYNRRMFLHLLECAIDQDRRYRHGLGLILCDLDHFKAINDSFGHGVGDSVLQAFATESRNCLREADVVARWGGEEFIILLLPSNLEKTRAVAEKLRQNTESLSVPPVERLSASFGITVFFGDDSIESFIKRADDALYKAKGNGRNRVEAVNAEITRD